jgi:acetylglutamate kinase
MALEVSAEGMLNVELPIHPQDLDNGEVAEVLSDALPYIMKNTGKTIVIKYGGHAMENEQASLQFAKDVVLLKSCGVNPVIVHGGGPQIASMLKRLSIETTFVEGLRVTDEATVDVAEMVLGSINKRIVSSVKQAGGRAVGLSGKDDHLLLAKKLTKIMTDPETGSSSMLDIGFVGDIKRVRSDFVGFSQSGTDRLLLSARLGLSRLIPQCCMT